MIYSICPKCNNKMIDFICKKCGHIKTNKDILEEYKNKVNNYKKENK